MKQKSSYVIARHCRIKLKINRNIQSECHGILNRWRTKIWTKGFDPVKQVMKLHSSSMRVFSASPYFSIITLKIKMHLQYCHHHYYYYCFSILFIYFFMFSTETSACVYKINNFISFILGLNEQQKITKTTFRFIFQTKVIWYQMMEMSFFTAILCNLIHCIALTAMGNASKHNTYDVIHAYTA